MISQAELQASHASTAEKSGAPRTSTEHFDARSMLDHDFIANVDSPLYDNTCMILQCSRDAIEDIVPLKEGLTNVSFKFRVGDTYYVYRHPGRGTDEIINRESETYSQSVAKRLGIDTTFIFEDAQQGWKISKYLPDCQAFDYHDCAHVKGALALARLLHTSNERSQWDFDVYKKAEEIVALLDAPAASSFSDFDELARWAQQLYACVVADNVEPCLCHNDFYSPNFLVQDDCMYLIDWEYSAMSDYASDLGTFICCSDYSLKEAQQIIAAYFGRRPTEGELRHCLAYVALSGYYWFVWALYKESAGDSAGEWLFLWHKAVQTYGKRALVLYEESK